MKKTKACRISNVTVYTPWRVEPTAVQSVDLPTCKMFCTSCYSTWGSVYPLSILYTLLFNVWNNLPAKRVESTAVQRVEMMNMIQKEYRCKWLWDICRWYRYLLPNISRTHAKFIIVMLNVETSSLEARNMRFVNIISSMVRVI